MSSVVQFQPWPKMARLSRECIVTEKIDGTNASIVIVGEDDLETEVGAGHSHRAIIASDPLRREHMFAGSRTRYIIPGDDNYGFAKWAQDHAAELFKLGPGRHFGEWWGVGIQRNYGLSERRFSLFKPKSPPPSCCSVVPLLYKGLFSTEAVSTQIERLKTLGSVAAPGFMKPEGVAIYHVASGTLFKKTIEGDDAPKSLQEAA